MAYSVETRVPFLDFRLVNFANELPINFKVNLEKGKYILRESMRDVLPKEIYESKIKNGFATPIDQIMKNSTQIKEILYQPTVFNFFNERKLKKLLDRYYKGDFGNQLLIFKILTIKIWFTLFFVDSRQD